MTATVFLDTETTSLRHDRRVWDIGMIVRDDEGEEETRQFFISRADLDLGNADSFSLEVGHFWERHPEVVLDGSNPVLDPDPPLPPGSRFAVYSEATALAYVEEYTHKAHLVGAVPWFDTEVLARRMRAYGLHPTWHYHLVDVENLAAGALGWEPPWNSLQLLTAYGLSYDEAKAEPHTALGDAEMARRLYDAVYGRRNGGQPPKPPMADPDH